MSLERFKRASLKDKILGKAEKLLKPKRKPKKVSGLKVGKTKKSKKK